MKVIVYLMTYLLSFFVLGLSILLGYLSYTNEKETSAWCGLGSFVLFSLALVIFYSNSETIINDLDGQKEEDD